MATVQRPEERYVDFDEYIDLQLAKARNGIKWTDILAAAAGVGALVVAYLVLFVIADHWLFEGGIPTRPRQILLGLVGVIALAWIGWKVVWPYVRRVNDLYAAQMLERAEPSLRGNLFGLVDSRRAGRPPIEEVRRALERRAATTLSDVDVDAALDRRLLMRMSYFLLGVVLVACVYAIASPKRVGPSLLRALLPSSNIGVATRTEILDVRPGDTTVLAGEQLTVSTMIRGETPERVMLFYSTADRRFVDEPVELRLVDETTREYQATLIGDAGRGLAQDLSYRIVANDDAAGPFAVEVDQPPAANIKSIALQYPPYTGLEPIERDTPPVEGIEGTNIALTAVANRPLRSAKLVFADDELFLARGEEVPLRISDDGLTLTASWKLAIRSDGSSPTFFRIECRDKAGKANPKPAVYPVKIYADAAPEVTLHDPKSDLERPANAVVPLLVTARDSDFRLRELTLRIEKRGQELPDRTVLWEGSAPEAAVRHDWDLGPLALKPGDIVSFYVQARDNREPEANRRNTPKLNIKITEPIAKEDVQRQLEEEKKRQDEEVAELEQNAAGADAEPQPNDEQLETAETEAKNTQNDQQQQNQNADGSDEQQEGGEGAAPNKGNQPSNDEANDRDSSVKNDGTQDDKVLRKLLERQREQQQKEAKSDQQQDQASSKESQPNEDDPSQPGEQQSAKPGEKGDGTDGSAKGDDQQQQSQSADRGENRNEQANGSKGSEKRDQSQNGKPNGDRSEQAENKDGDNRPQNAADRTSEQRDEQTGDERTASGNKRDADSDQKQQKPSANESNDAGPAGSESPQGEGNAGQNSSAKGSPQDQNAKAATGEGTSAPMDSGDSERSETKPQSSQPTDEPSGNADPNPGEGRPDQKSQKPDSGEQGTGQPNVDGTPDGQTGPGDAGTQPGSQQESNDATGQQGVKATEKGRPGQGTSPQAKGGTPSAEQANDPKDSQPSSKMSDPAQASEKNSQQSENAKEAPAHPSQESSQQPAAQQNSDKPSGQSDNSAKSSSNQNEPTASDPSQSDPASEKSGMGEDGMGKSGEGKSGEGKSGEGKSGEGKSGEGKSGEGKSGEGKSGEGKSGEGKSGEGQSGKGEAGGAGGQAGESGAPGQQGGKTGQPGGKPGAKGGEGGGAAPAEGAEGGTAQGDGAGDGNPPEATAEEANPEYTKQATDLALKKLEDDLARGEVDPELLKQLGWTEDDMRRFADRLRKNLDAPTGDETPQEIAHRKEFEHMLENLTIEGTPQAREGRNNRVRNVEGVGTKRPPIPSAYRDAYEAFTRRVANRRATSAAPGSTSEESRKP